MARKTIPRIKTIPRMKMARKTIPTMKVLSMSWGGQVLKVGGVYHIVAHDDDEVYIDDLFVAERFHVTAEWEGEIRARVLATVRKHGEFDEDDMNYDLADRNIVKIQEVPPEDFPLFVGRQSLSSRFSKMLSEVRV